MNHRGTEHTEVAQRRACMPTFRAKPAYCTDDGTSKSEDRLDHRNPAGHSRRVRTKCSAIRSSLNPHQLAGYPQTLRWQEIPLGPCSVLIRVGKLSEDL